MPTISRTTQHKVNARKRLDAPHIHIHNHICTGKKRPKAASKPPMVDAFTQTAPQDFKETSVKKPGLRAKLGRFGQRAKKNMILACGMAWSVFLFYARRMTVGVNLADAIWGRRR